MAADPRVRSWLAWNEPNNPAFLRPQYRKVAGRSVAQSPIDYAKICNAIVKGRQRDRSAPRRSPAASRRHAEQQSELGRPALAPIAFLRGMKLAGATGFDAYAHHPYYGSPAETPSTPPPTPSRGQAPTAVTLGNIDLLDHAR